MQKDFLLFHDDKTGEPRVKLVKANKKLSSMDFTNPSNGWRVAKEILMEFVNEKIASVLQGIFYWELINPIKISGIIKESDILKFLDKKNKDIEYVSRR